MGLTDHKPSIFSLEMVEWAHENKSSGEFIHRKHKGVWVGKEQNRRSKEIFWSNWNLPFPENANNIG